MTSLQVFVFMLLLFKHCFSQELECGKSFMKLKDLGEIEEAKQGAWPWMVHISVKNKEGSRMLCNGFLFERRHILTSASCFGDKTEPSKYSVSIGNVDRTKGEEYSIKSISVHPGFRTGEIYDDIAMVILDTAVDNPGADFICLPWSRKFRNITGKETALAAWATTRPFGDKENTDILKQMNAGPVITNEKCKKVLREKQKDIKLPYTGYMCAGFMKPGRKNSFCMGDQGSPLMYQDNEKWYAVGIVSFGIMCNANGATPVGYTKVQDYLSWVDRTIEEEE